MNVFFCVAIKRGFDCMVFHPGQMTHLCQKSMLSLVQLVCCASSHYLNQCCLVDLNIRIDGKYNNFTQENKLENVVCILSHLKINFKLKYRENLFCQWVVSKWSKHFELLPGYVCATFRYNFTTGMAVMGGRGFGEIQVISWIFVRYLYCNSPGPGTQKAERLTCRGRDKLAAVLQMIFSN